MLEPKRELSTVRNCRKVSRRLQAQAEPVLGHADTLRIPHLISESGADHHLGGTERSRRDSLATLAKPPIGPRGEPAERSGTIESSDREQRQSFRELRRSAARLLEPKRRWTYPLPAKERASKVTNSRTLLRTLQRTLRPKPRARARRRQRKKTRV